MLDIVLQLLFEVVVQVFGEFAFTLGWESLAHALRGSRKANPIFALVGWAIIGATCGAIGTFLVPYRILPPSRLRGMSLIVAPLITGALMRTVGDRRRKAGKDTTVLATFWGGSLFAFSAAVTRFLLIRAS
jgi:hypothetical protein